MEIKTKTKNRKFFIATYIEANKIEKEWLERLQIVCFDEETRVQEQAYTVYASVV
ncbi:hypothetical protein HNQ34_002056 [Anoxybacillus tepidamans]|uniref:Uncharacterized protein n=1 Tax=Anoxybacteroides tepidamans TaxID=265948 RepID=A0A7W8MUW9_9BACL|nr:hypothetical protein [Anoxybacillus tepidamans]MBB5324957.1 hypothetical protein [Anoxybacillus tepidamans]